VCILCTYLKPLSFEICNTLYTCIDADDYREEDPEDSIQHGHITSLVCHNHISFNDVVMLTKPAIKTFLQTGRDDPVDLDSPGCK